MISAAVLLKSCRARAALLMLFVLLSPLPANADLESSLKTLAQSLVNDLRGRGIKKLAALDFRDIRGYRSALDPFLAEELVNQVMLAARGEFTFIERRQLDRVISEQKLTSSAFFDSTTLAEVGKILGVDGILTGSIADLGTEVRINARAIAVQTGEVFATASTNVAKDGAVAELLRQGTGLTNESGLGQPIGSSPTNPAPPRQLQATDVFFENKLVRVTVSGAALAPDKRSLTLSLVVENVASGNLLLAVPIVNANGNCAVTVSDSQGNLLKVRRFELGGIPCVYESRSKRPESYATFLPRSRTTIVAKFANRHPIGGMLALGMELQVLSGERTSRFSAGISNIQVR